jgi:hypothetical protein
MIEFLKKQEKSRTMPLIRMDFIIPVNLRIWLKKITTIKKQKPITIRKKWMFVNSMKKDPLNILKRS